jgi:hypothetical protein
MNLKSSSAKCYPKFPKLGDSVTGDFISYEENVPSQFGSENLVTLQGPEGKLIVRTPTNLSRTLRENLDALPGKRLTITFTREVPSRKGKPVKVFCVDAVDISTTTTVTTPPIATSATVLPPAMPPTTSKKVE